MRADRKRLLIRFGIELAVYAILVSIYLVLVLRTMGDWLLQLSEEQRTAYAFIGLALIVAQGLVLEMVTSFLLDRLGLE
ncbi:MAG: hypothetical protein ACK2U9_16985 [Anaerolineae bacterium]|jgi:hypothetical protein